MEQQKRLRLFVTSIGYSRLNAKDEEERTFEVANGAHYICFLSCYGNVNGRVNKSPSDTTNHLLGLEIPCTSVLTRNDSGVVIESRGQSLWC